VIYGKWSVQSKQTYTRAPINEDQNSFRLFAGRELYLEVINPWKQKSLLSTEYIKLWKPEINFGWHWLLEYY